MAVEAAAENTLIPKIIIKGILSIVDVTIKKKSKFQLKRFRISRNCEKM